MFIPKTRRTRAPKEIGGQGKQSAKPKNERHGDRRLRNIFAVAATFTLMTTILTPLPAFAADPAVSSVSPTSGPVGGGTAITITGTNFPGGTPTVQVGGGTATSVVRVSVTSITAVTPAGTAGARDIVVSWTSPPKSATGVGLFTYKNTYSVTYSGNGSDGGTSVVDGSSPYLDGSTVTVLANTYTKTGYSFDHWNTAANNSGTSYSAANTFSISANTVLYAQWLVVSVTLRVFPDAQSMTYGDPVPIYTFTLKDPGDNTVSPGTLTSYTAPVCTSSYAVTTHVSASTLTITCSGGSADNRTFNTSATALLTINKATLTVTPDAKSVDYGDPVSTYSFGVTGFENGESVGTPAGWVAPTCNSTYAVTTPVSSSPVDITCSGGFANDYIFDTTATAHVTIGAATLTVNPDAQPVDYGDPVPTYTFGVTGFKNGETVGTPPAGWVAPTCNSTYAVTTSVLSSPLDITCSGGFANDYIFDTTATAHVTISKATLTVTPDAKTRDYGDPVPIYTFGVTGFKNGETEADPPAGWVAPTCNSTYAVTTPVSSSPRDITCSGGSANNYTFDTTATAHVTISKATLTVTPDAKTRNYGAPVPTYTFSVTGFMNGENEGTAVGWVAPTCNSTYAVTTPVSSSPVDITCSGGSANNYTFDTTATAHVTISKATLTIFPYAQSRDYGDPVPTYGFGVIGFMNDENAATASGYVAPTCNSTYAVTTPVSSSPLDITCSGGSANNYIFDTTATAHLTISKATLTVTPDAKPVDYGDPVPTYSFSVTGFMNSENEGTASGFVTPTCNGTYAVTTPVLSSPLDITCSGGSADNYIFDTTATAHVTISKATLTVTPDNKSVHYSDAPPTYTFGVTGFKNGETAGTPPAGWVAATCNSTYTSSTPVSSSPVDITCSGGSADNYTFDTTAKAHVTISQAHTTVQYNGSQLVLVRTNATLALIFSGPSAGCTGTWTYTFDPSVSGSPFSYTSPGGSHSIDTTGWASGVYEITVAYSGDANCLSSSDDTGTLTVASPGDNAYGGGWSTYNGFGKANFGFEVHALPNTLPVVYKGQLVWNLKNNWRFKGTLDNYGTAMINSVQTGIATGTGTLYWWDWTLNAGYGGWAFAGSSVKVTITFTATTPSTKKKNATTGTFGINVEYTPTAGQPALPTSDAQSLKGGSIKLS